MGINYNSDISLVDTLFFELFRCWSNRKGSWSTRNNISRYLKIIMNELPNTLK